MSKMSPEEILAFLEEPHIAHLVTLRPDGSPHAAPVWYEYHDDVFVMFTPSTSQKIRNLKTDSRASISMASLDEPYRYVVAEGTVEASDTGFEEVGARIAARYRGVEAGAAFATELRCDNKMIVLIMKPRRLVSYLGD